ncbi:hypothetical protein A2U01_0083546, partial [Trifolium medium]|nr:hypothetical protein [Trifolium medium]
MLFKLFLDKLQGVEICIPERRGRDLAFLAFLTANRPGDFKVLSNHL